MSQAIIWKALIGAVITLGTTLITLFSGQGVVNFSDISPVQYAVAVIGAVLAAASVLQAALTDSPAQSVSHQSGHARLPFLLALCVASLIGIVSLPGCATPPTPLHTVAAISTAIEQIAVQVDLAQKEGRISNEREDHLMDELKRINGQLRSAMYLVGDQQQTDLQAINEALIELRAEMAKEQKQ